LFLKNFSIPNILAHPILYEDKQATTTNFQYYADVLPAPYANVFPSEYYFPYMDKNLKYLNRFMPIMFFY